MLLTIKGKRINKTTLGNMVRLLTLAVWNAGISHVVITGTVKTDIVVAITAINNVNARLPLAAVTYEKITQYLRLLYILVN